MHNPKKALSLALALVMALTLLPSPVSAAIAPPAAGSIPISDRRGLAAMADNLSGTYHLTNDIDLSGEPWIPIRGPYVVGFSGIFDGQGYVIRNMTIKEITESSPYSFAGLFCRLNGKAEVKNIGFENVNINITTPMSHARVGAVCGDIASAAISNAYVTGTISLSGGFTPYAGGIAGVIDYGGAVSDCFNGAAVSCAGDSTNVHAGGVTGSNNGDIKRCFNAGAASASTGGTTNSTFAGGITGASSGDISSCFNAGAVSSPNSHRAGGIVGIKGVEKAAFTDCYWNLDSSQIREGKELSNDEKKGVGQGDDATKALSAEQMKTESSYVGWDFSPASFWGFKPGANGGYPVLRAFYEFPSAWAETQVHHAVGEKIVPNHLQTKYTANITRAEFCALAVALYETRTGQTITERKTFSDSSDPNVEKMAGIGVVSGDAGKFNPGGTFSREMAAVLFVNLLKAMDIHLPEAAPAFADSAGISSWAQNAVGQVQAAGLMSGSNNNFAPSRTFTREESILLTLNLYEYLLKQ